MWKPDGDKLVLDVGSCKGPAAWIEGSTPVTFSKGQGVPGRAWASGSVEFAPNVQNLPVDKYPRLTASEGGEKVGSGFIKCEELGLGEWGGCEFDSPQ